MKTESEEQLKTRQLSESLNPYASECPNKQLWSEGFRKGFNLANQSKWVSVETPPEEGVEVIGYSKEWIHPDFNLNGTRVCFLNNGEWTSSKWDNDQDSWHTHSEWCCKENGGSKFNPTHWQPLPSPPNQP